MKGGVCRACEGPLTGPRPLGAGEHSAEVRITARSPNKRREGYFRLCPRCVSKAITGHYDLDVATALAEELRALLK